MSNAAFKALSAAPALAQLAIAGWVIFRRRNMAPVLVVNLLFAAAVFWFIASYLPDEIAYISSGAASELFDYKNSILAVFEGFSLIVSLVAFGGARWARMLAWAGFVGNFGLDLLVVLFAFTFEFKCCGYL